VGEALKQQDGSDDIAVADTATGSTEMNSRDLIYHAVLEALHSGRYKPGQRLTEAQLTEQFGVSRGPVREALSRLAANGVVMLIRQRGAQIRTLSVHEAINITVVAQTLTGLACRLAAMQIQKPGAADTLRQSLADVMRASGSDHLAFIESRGRFYQDLIGISGNDELKRILPLVQFQLIPVQYPVTRNIIERHGVKDLRRIAEAVLAGRPSVAEAAAVKHISRAVDALQMLLRPGER
jgi:DNA-binding GntR family transcriptional regulator